MAAAPPPPQAPQAAIVITGKALPEAKSERVYDVQLISRRQIEQSPSHELDQLLKDIPGLELFRRSDARSGHPTSQGVTLRALGGNASSRALLVLDGVPQADPFGGWVNWPAYDPADLSEIRVVRGGGSVANGPGALAGTIEMTSRSDSGLSGELDAGSRDSLDARGRAAVDAGGGVLSLSARGQRSDGFIPVTEATRGPADEAAPYHDWSSRARWVAPLASDTELQASLDGFHDWRTRGTDFTENRTNGADASVRLVGRGPWQWSALGYWQWRNLMSSFASVTAGRMEANRVSLQYSVPSHGLGSSLELRPPMPRGIELRLGADTRRTTGESREFFSYVDGDPTRRRAVGGDSWTAGAYAEATADLGGATLTGGARVDHWSITNGHLFEQTIATGAVLTDTHDPSRGGWLPTVRGGVTAPLGGGVRLRSAAYLGWRMPTLNELFRPFRAGSDATAANPDLNPERLAGAEAGLEYARGPLQLSLTGFVNRLRDAIANVTMGHGPGTFPGVGFVGPGGTYFVRENVDAVKVRGIEASANWSDGHWFARAGASFTHARMEGSGSAEFLDGLRPAQTPNFGGTLAVGWEDGRRSVQLVLRRVGAQFDDDLNTGVLRGATTLDAFASWPLANRLDLVARAENLTNSLVMAGINGDNSVERATPRTLWIGLELR
ncbi:MAG TPA: TonB-dependent receptor [Sphingomicrobium sp.]|nr:TonB-dependent receptor [Sphingomicrobium sp.]